MKNYKNEKLKLQLLKAYELLGKKTYHFKRGIPQSPDILVEETITGIWVKENKIFLVLTDYSIFNYPDRIIPFNFVDKFDGQFSYCPKKEMAIDAYIKEVDREYEEKCKELGEEKRTNIKKILDYLKEGKE